MPGQHGCLNNPSFYGSSVIPKLSSARESRLERLDDTTVSMTDRSKNVRSRCDFQRMKKSFVDESRLSNLSLNEDRSLRKPEDYALPGYRSQGLPRAISPAIEGRHGPSRRTSPSPARLSSSLTRISGRVLRFSRVLEIALRAPSSKRIRNILANSL